MRFRLRFPFLLRQRTRPRATQALLDARRHTLDALNEELQRNEIVLVIRPLIHRLSRPEAPPDEPV